MVPWLQAASPSALRSVSTRRWLVSMLPPTMAGARSGSRSKSGFRRPRGMVRSTARINPSFKGSGRCRSSRSTYMTTLRTTAVVALRLPGWTPAEPVKSIAARPSLRVRRTRRTVPSSRLSSAAYRPGGTSLRASRMLDPARSFSASM